MSRFVRLVAQVLASSSLRRRSPPTSRQQLLQVHIIEAMPAILARDRRICTSQKVAERRPVREAPSHVTEAAVLGRGAGPLGAGRRTRSSTCGRVRRVALARRDRRRTSRSCSSRSTGSASTTAPTPWRPRTPERLRSWLRADSPSSYAAGPPGRPFHRRFGPTPSPRPRGTTAPAATARPLTTTAHRRSPPCWRPFSGGTPPGLPRWRPLVGPDLPEELGARTSRPGRTARTAKRPTTRSGAHRRRRPLDRRLPRLAASTDPRSG